MSVKLIIYFAIFKFSSGQLNGEFWWLNDKLKQIKGIEPLPPKFEELTEFDTDESSKITFKDENLIESNYNVNNIKNITDKKMEKTLPVNVNIIFPDNFVSLRNKYLKPPNKKYVEMDRDEFLFRFPNDVSSERPDNKHDSANATEKSTDKNEGFIGIKFPEDQDKIRTGQEFVKVNNTINANTLYNQTENMAVGNKFNSEKKEISSENICSNVKKNECYRYNGPLYTQEILKISGKMNTYFVCCILPIIAKNKQTIIFPDTYKTKSMRFKRSSKNIKKTSSHRDFLLRKRYEMQNVRSTIPTRIVTYADDYVDPYWNIKTSNTKSANIKNTECNYKDYIDHYAAELPKPGLVGIYSDSGPRPASWSSDNPNPYKDGDSDYSYEDDENVFGYSTVDPRRLTSSYQLNKGRPVKVSTAPPVDEAYDVESQTIKFQANPNFQVLQGFKLLNFARSKNKLNAKITRSTTESGADGETSETLETEIGTDSLPQVYEHCGKFSNNHYFDSPEKETGDADIGAHPWLAVLVSSSKRQHIVCYATIVHPLAAITAGDCVVDFKRPSKEKLLLVAGLREINDVASAESRLVTIQSHPQWREQNLSHNLALLHWTRPLRLNTMIQPACLADSSQTFENCKFYGWGGFDQGMRQRPKWQRASTVLPDECVGYFSKTVKLPGDALCAMVESHGTVTGLGGSLVCEIGGRATAVGVAVHRDKAVVLLPAQKWILRAMEDLGIA